MRGTKTYLSWFLVTMLLFVASQSGIAGSLSLLGAGDVIKITVYGQSDLTTVTRIRGDGKISFPLIGDVKIGDMSTTEAERRIATLLERRGYVTNAQVGIFVEQRIQTAANSVTIIGQIARPGKYPVQEASVEGVYTLVDLLAVAGGTNVNAADHLLLIKKQGKQRKIKVDLVALLRNGELKNNYTLDGGDIVLVPEMDVFYIYGQVNRPGRYRLERSMTVMQAISVAGGVTSRGSESSVWLKRRDKGEIKSFNVDLTDELQVDDVIYFKESLF